MQCNSFEKSLVRVKQLTEQSSLIEAYIACCKLLGEPALDIKMELDYLLVVRIEQGGLNLEQNATLYRLYSELMKLAKELLNSSQYHALVDAT